MQFACCIVLNRYRNFFILKTIFYSIELNVYQMLMLLLTKHLYSLILSIDQDAAHQFISINALL